MSSPAADPGPGSLPPLPERVEPELLRELTDSELRSVHAAITESEQAIRTAMAPYERQLKELRARAAELATEQRRRERAQRHAARVAVRSQAGSGEMPTVAEALAAPESPVDEGRALASVRAFLTTGGEVGFGYPTRPGAIAFTDGRQVAQATTFGEARRLFAEGWEPGAVGLPGLRVHLVGTRVERVVADTEVVLERSSTPGAEPGGQPRPEP
ncbi:MAG: hypothetical protein E6J14_02740 [Chloroflexi bacterium]|nr:MAG: hypothetical protein E6J14_02740 [Chloroflexota bacterium]